LQIYQGQCDVWPASGHPTALSPQMKNLRSFSPDHEPWKPQAYQKKNYSDSGGLSPNKKWNLAFLWGSQIYFPFFSSALGSLQPKELKILVSSL